MLGRLLIRRWIWLGGLFAALGLYEAFARLPGGMGSGAYAASSLWVVGTLACAGGSAGLLLAAIATTVARAAPMNWRASFAAAIETLLWLPLLLWLILNEAVYATTSEVVGYDTLMMTWHNPAATFQNAWQMAGRYLVGVGVVVLVGLIAIAWLARRSYGLLWPGRPADLLRRAAKTTRPARSIRMAAPCMAMLIALALLLTWQIQTTPGVALTTAFKSAPPLKALNLARAIVGDKLLRDTGEPGGEAIISDEAYAQRIRAAAPTSERPNVILIVLESVPAKALHCYGHPREDVTPHMDALAQSGVLFDHCWSTASFSSYGLISVMTSLYLLRDETNDHFTDHDFPHMSIPRALKLAGYETALFSSGNETFDHINAFCRPQDFDRYYTHETSGIQHPDCMRMDDHYAFEEFEKWMRQRAANNPTLPGNSPTATSGLGIGRGASTGNRSTDPHDQGTRQLVDAPTTNASGRKPFYAGFYLQATHFDYAVPEPWSKHYQPTPPLFGNGNTIIKIPPDVLPLLRNQYDNAMRYSDHWVGRIVDTLRQHDAFDDCVIAIIGDHGEAFMEHGLARHGLHLWEEMLHVPLIFYVGPQVRARFPSLSPRVADTVSGLDVAPTLAALAGVPAHPSWQGMNILAPGYSSRERPIYAVLQLTRWQEAVTLNKLKYIYDLYDVEPYLFDLQADPMERRNLLNDRPADADRLHELLAAWHTHQLSYYRPQNRPFRRYVGLPK